jgi:hypothetical protein
VVLGKNNEQELEQMVRFLTHELAEALRKLSYYEEEEQEREQEKE